MFACMAGLHGLQHLNDRVDAWLNLPSRQEPCQLKICMFESVVQTLDLLISAGSHEPQHLNDRTRHASVARPAPTLHAVPAQDLPAQ